MDSSDQTAQDKKVTPQTTWDKFPATYREAEMRQLTRWVAAGQSGSVVGLPGCGRSNLLGFFSHRADLRAAYQAHSPTASVIVPVNLHNLPATDIATFYRALLRDFYHASDTFDLALQKETQQAYDANITQQDPFVPQSALQTLLRRFQQRQIRVVMVLNYLQSFLDNTDANVVNTLRGLRDSFKGTLCLIAGLPQEMAYLPDVARLGDLRELLDRNVCWVGAMSDADAKNLIARAILTPPGEDETAEILRLAGSFPALLKLIANWWANQTNPPPMQQWPDILGTENNIVHRLSKIWRRLTQEEQFALFEAHNKRLPPPALKKRQMATLQRLEHKGVCEHLHEQWHVRGKLLAAYVAEVGGASRGKIWQDPETQAIYQGLTRIENLTPLEMRLLRYFILNPHRPHATETLIEYVWEEKSYDMASNDLQQLVYRLRKKVDTVPPHYIVTWSDRHSGYQFYPEGQPR